MRNINNKTQSYESDITTLFKSPCAAIHPFHTDLIVISLRPSVKKERVFAGYSRLSPWLWMSSSAK